MNGDKVRDITDILNIMLDNWAQVVVILGAIGYIINIIVTGYTKRQEIKYSIIQNDRIKEIKNFYITCRHLQQAIERFQYVDYKKIDKGELEEKNSNFNNLNTKFLSEYSSMRILLDRKDLQDIEKFQERFKKIQGDLYRHLLDKATQNWDLETRLDESEKMEDTLKQLPELILKLETILRKYTGVN